MTIREMIKRVNMLTGQGIYDVDDLLPYFDECIDEINQALTVELPAISDVYNNDFEKTEYEDGYTYVSPGYKGENGEEALDNNYRRIHDAYLRNYVCYETSYRVLRDEDEDEEVYVQRANHARTWLNKIISNLGDYRMAVGDTVLVGDDVPDTKSKEDWYNPYWKENE